MQDRPFRPSWQDRFLNSISRFIVPTVFVDLLLTLLVGLLFTLVSWVTNASPLGTIPSGVAILTFWFFVLLTFSHFLQASSRKAIDEFRPALPINEKEFSELRYSFLHVPNNAGWLLSFFGFLLASSIFYANPDFIITGTNNLALSITGLVLSIVIFSLLANVFWLVIHQLRLISKMYRMVDEINLLNLGPLTALSDLTLRISLPFIFASILSYITNIALAENPVIGIGLFFIALNLIMAIGVFVIPLLEMHERLLEVKEKLMAGNSDRLTLLKNNLDALIDKANYKDAGNLKAAISALLDLRTTINSTSTWPWETTTLKNFFSALLLPLFIWLIQNLMQRIFAI